MTDSPRPDPQDDQQELARLVRQAVDIVRYAPIGVLIDGPSLLPQLAEQGKVHVKNAQMLGRMALRRGRHVLGHRLDEAGEQATDLLRMFGLVPGDADDVDVLPDDRRGTASPARRAGRPAEAPEDASAEPSPDVDELAIPEYDSLSASQVVNRLPGLSDTELQAVRVYEAAHRGRKTILNKVAQLQA